MINILDVPVNTCPLDVLSKMGEEIRGSKILFNSPAFAKFAKNVDTFEKSPIFFLGMLLNVSLKPLWLLR